jgi:hypothetical protein
MTNDRSILLVVTEAVEEVALHVASSMTEIQMLREQNDTNLETLAFKKGYGAAMKDVAQIIHRMAAKLEAMQ